MIAVGGDLLPEWGWWVVGIVALVALVAGTLVGISLFAAGVAWAWDAAKRLRR